NAARSCNCWRGNFIRGSTSVRRETKGCGDRDKSQNRFSVAGRRDDCRLEALEVRQLLAAAAAPVVPPLANFVPQQHDLFQRNGYLSKAAAGKPLDIALGYLKNNAAALGVTAADGANPIV